MNTQLENSLFEQLLESPRLPLYARKIQGVLAEEAQRREAFYAQIQEGDKLFQALRFLFGRFLMRKNTG